MGSRYVVNLHRSLPQVMAEAKRLVSLGMYVPSVARNVVMEEESLQEHVRQIQSVLDRYYGILHSLDNAETILLQGHLSRLRHLLKAPAKRMNWCSLIIPLYVEKTLGQLTLFDLDLTVLCFSQQLISFDLDLTVLYFSQQLTSFENLVKAIQRINEDMESILDAVRNQHMFKQRKPLFAGHFYNCKEALDYAYSQRDLDFDILSKRVSSIGVFIFKMESVLASSHWSQETSPYMTSYYLYWEKKIFNAITTVMSDFARHCKIDANGRFEWAREISLTFSTAPMVVRNLKWFIFQLKSEKPLFAVESLLAPPDVILNPQTNDIYKTVVASAKDMVSRAKKFTRWLNGTCTEAPPQRVKFLEEPYVFSYFPDVACNAEVFDLVAEVDDAMFKALVNVQKYMSRWKKHRHLWKSDKDNALQTDLNKALRSLSSCFPVRLLSVQDELLNKWMEKPRTAVDFDYRFQFYQRCIREVEQLPQHKDIGCIHLNTEPLAEAAVEHAQEWINLLARKLGARAAAKVRMIYAEMMDKWSDLDDTTDNLEELKAVLTTIQSIKDSLLVWETKWRAVQEDFRTLTMYSDEVPKEELQLQKDLPFTYQTLLMKAKKRDNKLMTVKEKFKGITANLVVEFAADAEAFYERFIAEGPGSVGDNLPLGDSLMQQYAREVDELEERRIELTISEKLLHVPCTVFEGLAEAKKQMAGLQVVYALYREQAAAKTKWSETLWVDLDIEVMNRGIDDFIKTLRKWPKAIKRLPAAISLDSQMKQFKDSLPLINDLKSDVLRERHWKELMEKTDQYFNMDPATFTLAGIFSMKLYRFTSLITEIVIAATKEYSIEKGIYDVEEAWKRAKFIVLPFAKGNRRGHILGPVDEIIQNLDDTSVNLTNMSASKFSGPFLGTVQAWERALAKISEVLEIMEATNDNPNIRACTHVENRLEELMSLSDGLEKCQKSLNDYLDSKRNAFPRFFFLSDDELLSILGSSDPECVQEHIIKMYDNIALLGFQKNPSNPKDMLVYSMISSEKEVMDFRGAVHTSDRVESWMLEVLAEMRRTNRLITKEAIFYYCYKKTRYFCCYRWLLYIWADNVKRFEIRIRIPRSAGIAMWEQEAPGRHPASGLKMNIKADWMLDYQGMVCLAASQVWWTWETEDVFRKLKVGVKTALKDYAKKMHMQIDQLVVKVRSDILKNDRKKYNTALIIDVHARDIIDSFVRDSIMDEKEFEWESQLRFYWVRDYDELYIRQCTGSFLYGYEYMGLNGRLVITPLTDRIYLTLTQALSMNLGGAPAGPAGTGKTETTKDLAKALGLLCVVTNCGEGMDHKAFGKILSGLCQCGAWGCMDEFNRIDISVLSVISTQLQHIRQALVLKLTHFQFEGVEIPIDSRVGVFITMNPGYAGRTELPESVKALFRPVVVIVPDLQQICEIMLFSEGFLKAKVLAKKMTVLYKLAREQLSKQFHYDFGLRALKSVLVMAGELKRGAGDLDEMDESMFQDVVLMRALRDMNLPKFVFEDVPLFLGLISDLFPGLECPRVRYPDFNDTVEAVLADAGYVLIPFQVDKVVQLYETMMTRHTTMLVGPTGGGKSVVLNTLAHAQTRLGTHTKLFTINPKERPVVELYGVLDPVTRDWTDGLLSNIFRLTNFREINKPTEKNERRYIVYDGDVDALWVENMNSVMDDNKLLTLSNGERIRLQPYCAMIFEVYDLQYASPATISRCGMVFVDPKNLGFTPYWEKWLHSRPEEVQKVLSSLYFKYVPSCIDLVIEGIQDGAHIPKLKTILPLSNLNMVSKTELF
ncbi:dynein heavy chain 10, axonemal [Plakobranchus ocellatus]|uniref:Dynein heavy chain 10, axonemal n=1 Tax=Plakobranchus ocellatus TaxID=259542 RepID=A0AAV4AMR2_9GAST|nr:dynein heavy chain 10, axonemal [Plakobranchus ocellatus]